MSKSSDDYSAARHLLVEQELRGQIQDERVLQALLQVPRHEFVPPDQRRHAYENRPLPIGENQTISQPLIVGLMMELLQLKVTDTVLEVGTGSGYQTALLASMAALVYSVEQSAVLSAQAHGTLERLNITNKRLKVGDGFDGWEEFAPFDAIVISAAAPSVPRNLVHQLARDGRLVLPLGIDDQELVLITKDGNSLKVEECGAVRFVPMLGKIQGD